ncbi:MAG TPA: acyltransferase, partial [Baekduia sp.]|nr:acyltransferase [Baekduia sp.]
MRHDVRDVAATAPSWGGRLHGIEGLRGLAALSVVAGHVWAHSSDGVALWSRSTNVVAHLHHGLTLFFALSGFLLYRPFATAILAGAPAPPLRSYLRNRALRIFPAYWVILLLASYVLGTTYASAASPTSGVHGVDGTLGAMTDPGQILANLALVQTYLPSTIKTGIGVSWSLTTELAFYLLLPALAAMAALALRRLGLRRRSAVLLPPLAMLVLGAAGKVCAAETLHASSGAELFFARWGANGHAVLERSVLAQADLFAYGMLAAAFFVAVERGRVADAWIVRVRAAATVAAVAVAAGLAWGLGPSAPNAQRLEDAVVGATCAGIILLTVLGGADRRATPLQRLVEARPLRWIGLASYSLYLWHVPVIWWLVNHHVAAGGRAGYLVNLVLVCGVSLALATLTYRFVELPAMRRKRRTDAPAPQTTWAPVPASAATEPA